MTATTLAVIPARGGSKRIPRKNIRALDGRPLLAWSIDLCRASGVFDDILVSTDDEEIADVARAAGASVPFLRPADLADDHAPTVDVIAHAVAWQRDHGAEPAEVACVYPASVFLDPGDILRARDLLRASGAPYVATIARFPYPIQRALAITDDGRLAFVDPTSADLRSQDLPERWHDAGQFYWGTPQAWTDRLPILANAVGYPVDGSRVVDIDTEEDWRRAEVLHRLARTATPGDGAGVG